MKTLNDYLFNKACNALEIFVIHKAEQISKEIGFGYEDSNSAPNSFKELKQAFEVSFKTRTPLPVYRGGSDKSIYKGIGGNWAFRFWHDVLHVTLDADFSVVGEAQVAVEQCKVIANRFGSDSLEYKIFAADVMGQVTYYHIHKKFVDNQESFVKMMIQEY